MKNDFQDDSAGGNGRPSSVFLAGGRFLAHLVAMHFWTLVGLPKFAAMKDSFTTFVIYVVVACFTAMLCMFVGAYGYPDSAEGMNQTLQLLLVAFGPIGYIVLVVGHRRYPNHLLAVLLACCTVVDVMYLTAHLLGYLAAPVAISSWFLKAFLAYFVVRSFRKAPVEVQQRGYGMRDGEF